MKKRFSLVCSALLAAGCFCLFTGCNKNPCGQTEEIFETPEELMEYFREQEANPDSPEPKLFLVGDSIVGLERSFIRVSWTHVSHIYFLDKPEEDMPSEQYTPPSELSVGSTSSIPPSSYEKVPPHSDRITIAWDYEQDGEERLKQSLANHMTAPEELPDHPGFYCYDVEEEGIVYEKSLYWVQDDCFFWAFIPIELYEEALAELTAPGFIQRIDGE